MLRHRLRIPRPYGDVAVGPDEQDQSWLRPIQACGLLRDQRVEARHGTAYDDVPAGAGTLILNHAHVSLRCRTEPEDRPMRPPEQLEKGRPSAIMGQTPSVGGTITGLWPPAPGWHGQCRVGVGDAELIPKPFQIYYIVVKTSTTL